MNITVIGIGLIGGSMALDLKSSSDKTKIIGVEANARNAQSAIDNGLVDTIRPLNEAIEDAELIVLAAPPDASLELLPTILDNIENQYVTDVCSVKTPLIKAIQNHPKRANYIAAHPMAGTEHSGPEASIYGLFDEKACIFCDTEQNSSPALQAVRNLYETLNMRIIQMDSESHDKHAAFVSHISHISSFALALTVLDKEQSEQNIFNLASGGFDSTVRLAKSAASMWRPVFELNRENILEVIDNYTAHLKNFREAIANTKSDEISELINESNKIKKVLK